RWGQHTPVGSVPPRFRTIQVWPKDLPALMRQVERAVDRPAAPTREKAHVRHEAARVNRGPRGRGARLAACGAGAPEETGSKQVELLAMAVPGLSRLAVLTNPNARNHGPLLQAAKTAAAKAAVTLVPVAAGTLQEIERAFELMTNEDIRATVFLPDPFLLLS